jgi:hypothetical protein
MIKKLLAILAAGLLAVGLLVSQAGAQVLNGADCVFTFDKTGVGTSNPLSDAFTWGTMSLTDDGNNIQVEFAGDLTNYSIAAIWLNYDFGSGPSLTNLTLASTWTANIDENGINADGYFSAGNFDIQINTSGVPNGILSSVSTDLDPSLFAVPNNNDLYAALWIRSSTLGDRFIFASTAECAPVPEPSTLLLLGAGLACLAGVTWRRRKNG